MLLHERQFWDQGLMRLAGVDEAGRGPLAGPVVAAAVVLPRDMLESEASGRLKDLTDSKQLSAVQRSRFFDLLHTLPGVELGVGWADAGEIDRINILRATHAAMLRAVQSLPQFPDHILVDGLPVPGLPVSSTAIVGGDGLSFSIAAASVIAKVTRDRHMQMLARHYPVYAFDEHKGYGSRKHIQALFEHGPCPEHRRSFRPVREAAGLTRGGPEDA